LWFKDGQRKVKSAIIHQVQVQVPSSVQPTHPWLTELAGEENDGRGRQDGNKSKRWKKMMTSWMVGNTQVENTEGRIRRSVSKKRIEEAY
jgi:hypothetical protein